MPHQGTPGWSADHAVFIAADTTTPKRFTDLIPGNEHGSQCITGSGDTGQKGNMAVATRHSMIHVFLAELGGDYHLPNLTILRIGGTELIPVEY
jgi:hypothetical protein